MRLLAATILLLAALTPSPAFAWWDYAHRVIAGIAEAEMSPRSRAEVRRLLARSALLDTPACPARTLPEAALWPDCIKRLGDRFSFAAPWHYQNIDICRPFDAAAACRDGNCISAQIERHQRLLADRAVPDRERIMALAFLVHLVGDLHQPLHAADRGDFGGNRFRLAYGIIPTNLHIAWDGYLAERGISTPPSAAAGLLGELSQADREAWRGGSLDDWQRESWQVARDLAYATVLPDPCDALPAERPVISEAVTRSLIPVVRRQAVRGGLRLARLLDQAVLDPDSIAARR